MSAFDSEADLVHVVCASLQTLLGGTAAGFYWKEWTLGARIADVACVSYAQAPHIEPEKFGRLTYAELRVAAELMGRPLRVDTVARRLRLPVQRVEATTRRLLRRGLVERVGAGTHLCTARSTYMPDRVVAVEAKLDDWRQAVQQAAYYRPFCDHAMVAMPMRFRGHEALYSACAAAGLGLMLLATSGQHCVPVRPRRPSRRGQPRRDSTALNLLTRWDDSATVPPAAISA